MKMLWLLILLLILNGLNGCAIGSGGAAYAVRAGSAHDLSSQTKQIIIEEAVKQANAYTDLKMKG